MATSGTNDTTTVILLCNFFDQSVSKMCLFATVPAAEDGEPPIDSTIVRTTFGPQAFATWEGNSVAGQFANNLGFTTQIQGNAYSQPISTQVGTGYHAPPFGVPPPGEPAYGFNVFNIFRDNGRAVYTDPNLGQCTTLYYCVFNGQTVSQIPEFVPIP